MNTVRITIPESMKEFVETQVAENGLSSPAEYILTLLQKKQQEQARQKLEALALEGIQSGDPEPVSEEFWDELDRNVDKAKDKVKRR